MAVSSTEAPQPPLHSELSRELTYEQKQLLANGRGSELVPAVLQRSRRRFLRNMLNTAVTIFMATMALWLDGPSFMTPWLRVLVAVFIGACALFGLVLAVHTYRGEQDYARQLLATEPSGETP